MNRPRIVRDRVLHAIRTAGRPIRAAEIADHVYADRSDGGPLAATEVVWATVRDLKIEGHRIGSRPGRSGGYVYLEEASA